MGTFGEELPGALNPLMELFSNSAVQYCLIIRPEAVDGDTKEAVVVTSSLPPDKRMGLLLEAIKVTRDKGSVRNMWMLP